MKLHLQFYEYLSLSFYYQIWTKTNSICGMRLDAGEIGKKFTDDIQQIQVSPIVPNFKIVKIPNLTVVTTL